jgi:hypothetical protein
MMELFNGALTLNQHVMRGLRESPDEVEAEGIRRAHRELERADRVLFVVDASDAEAVAAIERDLDGSGRGDLFGDHRLLDRCRLAREPREGDRRKPCPRRASAPSRRNATHATSTGPSGTGDTNARLPGCRCGPRNPPGEQ